MGSSRCRAAIRLAALLGCVAAGSGCSLRATASDAARATTGERAVVDAGIELPPDPARDVLIRACLGCHDLGGIGLFAGFYSHDDWRTLVLTMVEHGAAVDAVEVELVSDYLAEHFGSDYSR